MEFDGKWKVLYQNSLKVLKERPGYDEQWETLLARYVFVNRKLEAVQEKMIEEEATIEHTNNDGHTNKATNPLMRIFVILNKESLALAKELQLTPAAVKGSAEKRAPVKTGFNLKGEMKVA